MDWSWLWVGDTRHSALPSLLWGCELCVLLLPAPISQLMEAVAQAPHPPSSLSALLLKLSCSFPHPAVIAVISLSPVAMLPFLKIALALQRDRESHGRTLSPLCPLPTGSGAFPHVLLGRGSPRAFPSL